MLLIILKLFTEKFYENIIKYIMNPIVDFCLRVKLLYLIYDLQRTEQPYFLELPKIFASRAFVTFNRRLY